MKIVFTVALLATSVSYASNPDLPAPAVPACTIADVDELITKQNCVLNNDQTACADIAQYSYITKGVIGGATGVLAGRMWGSLLAKNSRVPNARGLIEYNDRYSQTVTKARSIVKPFQDKFRASNDFGRAPGTTYQEFRVSVRKAALDASSDPLLKAILDSYADTNVDLRKQVIKDLGRYFNTADVEVAANNAIDDGRLNQRQKLIRDLIWKYENVQYAYSPQVRAVGISTQMRMNRTINENRSRTNSAAIKGAVVGASSILALDFGSQIAFNAWDKSQIAKCKGELGLTDDEVTLLQGQSGMFVPPHAKSDSGRFGFTCSKLRIQDLNLVAQLTEKNNGQVSPGLCKIMQNSTLELDNAFKDITSVRDVSCDGFKAANFELVGKGFAKTFRYTLSDDTYLEAAFDGQTGWPDYTRAKVIVNGALNLSKTEDFRSKHQRHVSSAGGTPRWDLQEFGECLVSEKNSEECKMHKAALSARVYYNAFKDHCAPETMSTKNAQPTQDKPVTR